MCGDSLIKYIKRITLVAGAALFVLSCRQNAPVNQGAIERQSSRVSNVYNKHVIDSGITLLQTGDLVMRTGSDITSYMISQMNQLDKTYSHCGIVIIENGYPFVYHSIGGEDNPDQKLKRDSASTWFSPASNLGFGIARFKLDSTHMNGLLGAVRQLYREEKKFDMDFDLQTDDRLYCAEFVYKAMNQAMKEEKFMNPVTLFGYSFVGVDNLFVNSYTQVICQIKFK